MKTVLKPEVDIMWTPELVKEYIWRPIQKAVVQKESTTELTTGELDQVFRVIEKHLGEKFGLEIVFPSQATLADKHSPWNAQDTSQ